MSLVDFFHEAPVLASIFTLTYILFGVLLIYMLILMFKRKK